MAAERTQRRLAAILAADVVGFSRLMESDEAGTLAALKSRRREVLDPLVAKHQGRIFKTTGDGVLVEFGSAVNAVQCAVELQHGMATANDELPEARRIVLRVGVNLGDVMVEGSDLYGDGVNIVARLEGIAEPGSILISGTAYEHVRNKVNTGFTDLGVHNLKNIVAPIHIYRADVQPNLAVKNAVLEKRLKPSIAVLPFANMSGDTEQQYFADGITDDIITELSRFRSLFVIARNSSFQFSGKATDVRRIADNLGVQYIVEGSVRRSSSALRITAQLIDAATGNHLWAERYDREPEQLFAVQDEVVSAIAMTVEGRLASAAAEVARRKPPNQMAAYDYMVRGRELALGQDPDAAEVMLRHAIELDPSYAQGHAWLSLALLLKAMNRSEMAFKQTPGDLCEVIYEEALASGKKAVALDEGDSFTHSALGEIYVYAKQYDLAAIHLDRAIFLNSSSTYTAAIRSFLYVCVGRPLEALQQLDVAKLRDPYPHYAYWFYRGIALYQLRRYDEAVGACATAVEMQPNESWQHAYLAACHAMAGQPRQAADHMALFRHKHPDATLALWAAIEPYEDLASLAHFLEGQRKAGLPE